MFYQQIVNDMKKVAILQSNYIPWKGYFDIINMVDEFILYDDMQYTKRDWRNRNVIKTPKGLHWLTIPVMTKGNFTQKICETEVLSSDWVENHWKTLCYNYSRAKCFEKYKDDIEKLYMQCKDEKYLSKINYIFLKGICNILSINTNIKWSSEYDFGEGKTERLVNICKLANAAEYISGPAAKNYIEASLFEKDNIKLTYMDYSGYKPYEQLYGEFIEGVSILDLIFNVGEDTVKYMKSFNK